MEEISRKTKLQKHYFATRMVSIGVNYTLLLAVLTILFGLLPIISIFIIFGYFVIAIFLSLFLIVGTLFLVLINVNDPTNPLNQLWSQFKDDAQQKLIDNFTNFSKVATPIMFIVTAILCIIFLVLISKRLGRSSVAKDRAIIIVSLILASIGMGLCLITYVAK